MKIALTTKGTDWNSHMDPRFGRTEYFLVFDNENDEVNIIDNRDSANDAHGAGPKAAQRLFVAKPDVLITGNGPGGNAAKVLQKSGIRVFIGAGDMIVKEALEAFSQDNLNELK